MIIEQRKNIQLQLDAPNIDSTSDDEDEDPNSLEMCALAHEVNDFGGNREFCEVAEDMYPYTVISLIK